MGGTSGGIYAQNYGGRNLQNNVQILFNTVIHNSNRGITTQWTSSSK